MSLKRPTLEAKETYYRPANALAAGEVDKVERAGLDNLLLLDGLLLRRPHRCQKRPTIVAKETYYMRTFESMRREHIL